MNFAKYPSLEGKTVLISGGAAGIGASLVQHFCAQGARVGYLDLCANTAETTASTVEADTGNRPLFQVCDLRDIAATRRAVDALEKEIGCIQVLINNAGHDEAHTFDEVTPEYWDDRVAVNLRHQYFLVQRVAGQMKAYTGGSIINMGSISWMIGAVGVSAYTTTKAAIMGMTKSLARELGPHDIRVNSIAPGWVLTERQQEKARKFPEKIDQYLEKQCLKTLLDPSDISRLALWLAADDSRHVTGQTMIVDGGAT